LDYTEVVPSIYREGGAGCDYKDSKKPERLLSFLMEYCTRPGDLVLDPFAGSGTTLACAVKADRLAVIIEKNADAMALIRRRIENLRMGLDIDATRYTFRVVEGLPLGDPATAGAALASD
jgi:DNA modification methylase